MKYLAILQRKKRSPHKNSYGGRSHIKSSITIKVIPATQQSLAKIYKEDLLPTAKIVKLPHAFFTDSEPSLKEFVIEEISRGNFTPMFKPMEISHE